MNKILKKRIEGKADFLTDNLNYKIFFETGAEYALAHQWISVEDVLPEPEEEIVLFNKNSIRHYEIGWLRKQKGYSKSKWVITNGFVEDGDITHWMPIPKFERKKSKE